MEPTDLLKEYAALSRRAVQTQWHLAKEYAEAAGKTAGRRPPEPAAWARTAGTEAARWWREAAKLGLGYGTAVIDLNRSTGRRLIDELGSPAVARVSMTLSGASGETVQTPLTIANTRATDERVSFAPGPLRGADGTGVSGAWSFTPTALDLAPGEEKQVQVALELADLAAGTRWTGTIAVVDATGTVLDVDVTVDVG